MNKTIVQSRITKLQSLQSIIELNEFLKFIDSNQSYSSELNKKVDRLVSLWSNSMPNMYSDPPCTWDDVISNRCIYYEFIEDKYYRNTASDDLMEMSSFVINKDYDEDDADGGHFDRVKKSMLKKLENSKLLMKIRFAEAAQFQGNHKLALNKLQQTKFILKEQSTDMADLQMTWMHCYLHTHLARCKVLNNPEDGLNTFLGAIALREIQKYDKSDPYSVRKDLYENQQILHGTFTKFLIDSLTRISNSDLKSNYFEKLNADDKKRTQLLDYIKTEDISNLDEVS